MLLVILVGIVFSRQTFAFSECLVPPFGVIGPECHSSNECTGDKDTHVTYTIVGIDGNTNIHCWGLGSKLLPNGCGDGSWGFIDLGILGEGDSWDVYWGTSIGIPTIKCSGQPLPAHITWSWSKYNKHSLCNGSCCGDICFDHDKYVCCTDYSPKNIPPGPVCLARYNPGPYDSCCGENCCDLQHNCCFGRENSLGCYNSNIGESCCLDRICTPDEHCCMSTGACCPNGIECDKCSSFF